MVCPFNDFSYNLFIKKGGFTPSSGLSLWEEGFF